MTKGDDKMEYHKEKLLFGTLHFLVFSIAIIVKNSFRTRTLLRDKYIDSANFLMQEMGATYGFDGEEISKNN